MNSRQIKFLHGWAKLLTLVACFFMSDAVSLAQIDAKDDLQIVPPPVPRYRRARPAFQVTADPTAKPLPLPTVIAEPPPASPPSEAKPTTPTPAQQAQSEASARESLRKEAARDRRADIGMTLGKVAGFLLVLGIGIFCVVDIGRQIRKAKQKAALREDDEESEWEP